MRKAILFLCAHLAFFTAQQAAAQSLDVPESPNFDDRLPKKTKSKDPNDLAFEITGEIEIDASSLERCSLGVYEQDDLNATLQLCNAAVEEEPENSLAYYYRGFNYYHLERYEEAEADFTRAIDLNSGKEAELYFMRGMCKQYQRRLREAAADFKKAYELSPDWSAARLKVEEYHWAYQ